MTARNCVFESLDRVPKSRDLYVVCFQRTTDGRLYLWVQASEPEIRESLECGGMSTAQMDYWFDLAKKAMFHCERTQRSH
jgi:hypothetical protein